MRLAIDTAFSACSAALANEKAEVVGAEVINQRRGQAETLAPLVEGVLKKAKVNPSDITEIVLNTGPGTFAGVRIATAFARALALVQPVKILGLSAFEALAGTIVSKGQTKPGEIILTLVPGKRGELSAALYEVNGKFIDLTKEPVTLPENQIGAYVGSSGVVLAGPDLENFQTSLSSLNQKGAFSFWPTATDLLEVAKVMENPKFSKTVSPFYLRPPDATPQKPGPFA